MVFHTHYFGTHISYKKESEEFSMGIFNPITEFIEILFSEDSAFFFLLSPFFLYSNDPDCLKFTYVTSNSYFMWNCNKTNEIIQKKIKSQQKLKQT
jgi:hypothetical protein